MCSICETLPAIIAKYGFLISFDVSSIIEVSMNKIALRTVYVQMTGQLNERLLLVMGQILMKLCICLIVIILSVVGSRK